jgi:hypothetical protein
MTRKLKAPKILGEWLSVEIQARKDSVSPAGPGHASGAEINNGELSADSAVVTVESLLGAAYGILEQLAWISTHDQNQDRRGLWKNALTSIQQALETK